jgi:hypothetical protein
MLSYIYQIANTFEQSHGIKPNLLYLNPIHFSNLREQLAELNTRDELIRFLGMEIIITPEAIHPQVVAANLHQMPAAAM